ncbi:MAG: NADPH-dependent FMN reductase [Sciscionella sp.]
MAGILTISASPSARSKTAGIRRLVDERLTGLGHDLSALDVRDLPAAALLAADTREPAIAAVLGAFERADGVVVATPVYKASYSGLLKTLLDLLPQRALADKVVLPLATGGSLAHVLVLDYALRPVLTSLGSPHIVQGHFVLDHAITLHDAHAELSAEAGDALYRAVDRFAYALDGTVAAVASSGSAALGSRGGEHGRVLRTQETAAA